MKKRNWNVWRAVHNQRKRQASTDLEDKGGHAVTRKKVRSLIKVGAVLLLIVTAILPFSCATPKRATTFVSPSFDQEKPRTLVVVPVVTDCSFSFSRYMLHILDKTKELLTKKGYDVLAMDWPSSKTLVVCEVWKKTPMLLYKGVSEFEATKIAQDVAIGGSPVLLLILDEVEEYWQEEGKSARFRCHVNGIFLSEDHRKVLWKDICRKEESWSFKGEELWLIKAQMPTIVGHNAANCLLYTFPKVR